MSHHRTQLGMITFKTLPQRRINLIPIRRKHSFLFQKMWLKLHKMRIQLRLMALLRRTQETDAQRQRAMMLTGKFY